MNLIKCIFIMVPVFLLAGCATPGQSPETGESNFCRSASIKEEAAMLPEVHYRAMQACLKERNEARTVDHFAIAGTDTWYEAIVRPGPQTETRHRALLSESLSTLSKAQKNQFWEMLNTRLRDLIEHKRVCSKLAAIGDERKKTQV
ncbi:hypothetical protein ACOZB2_21720, partial [Pantoea endophytica]